MLGSIENIIGVIVTIERQRIRNREIAGYNYIAIEEHAYA
jgi:hypothetical protein